MAAQQDDPKNADDLNFQLRQNINDAYAFVEGSKTTQTFAALTFEDLMDAQITTLTGPDTATRPNPLNRVTQILQNITNTVSQIKALPDDAFQARDDTDSTNTPPDGDDPYNGDPNATSAGV
jgi:hypothetical protein